MRKLNFYRDDEDDGLYVLCAKSELGFASINRDDWVGVKSYRVNAEVKPVIAYDGDEPKIVKDGFSYFHYFKTLKEAKQDVRDFLEVQ